MQRSLTFISQIAVHAWTLWTTQKTFGQYIYSGLHTVLHCCDIQKHPEATPLCSPSANKVRSTGLLSNVRLSPVFPEVRIAYSRTITQLPIRWLSDHWLFINGEHNLTIASRRQVFKWIVLTENTCHLMLLGV